MSSQSIFTIKEKLLKYLNKEYDTTIPITEDIPDRNINEHIIRYNPVIYNQNINQNINPDINPVINNEDINRNIITNLTYRNI